MIETEQNPDYKVVFHNYIFIATYNAHSNSSNSEAAIETIFYK